MQKADTNIMAIVAEAFELLSEVEGVIDEQTYDQHRKAGDLGLPDDADLDVMLTVAQERKFMKAMRLLDALVKAQAMPDRNSLHSEYDAIGEALDDAICNGDGRPTAKHLLVELEHRGLKIIPVQDAESARAEQAYEAKAKLMAAAPELLAALKNLRPRFYACCVANGSDPEYADAACARADAAIAAAEQKS